MNPPPGPDRVVATVTGSSPDADIGPTTAPLPPARPPTARWRWLAVVVAVATLAAGLVWQLTRSDDSGGDVATPPAVPTTEVSPATTVPEPLDPSRPPELRNTGEDFDTIVRSVHDFDDWVYRYDPDPKWVPFFMDPRDVDEYGFEWTKGRLAELKAAGQRFSGPTLRILKVIPRDRVNENQIGIYVVYEGVPGAVVDRDGAVVKEWPVLPPTGFLEEWVRGEDGRWRPFHAVVLGPPAPEILK